MERGVEMITETERVFHSGAAADKGRKGGGRGVGGGGER